MTRVGQSLVALFTLVCLCASIAAPSYARQAEGKQLEAAQLKAMLAGMGFEVKETNSTAGKESYEVTHKNTNFNVPMSYSLSSSGRYIWLTVSLGANSPTKKHEALLKANTEIQPAQFYITASEKLMCALAVENRDVTPVILKRATDHMVTSVDLQSSAWQDPKPGGG